MGFKNACHPSGGAGCIFFWNNPMKESFAFTNIALSKGLNISFCMCTPRGLSRSLTDIGQISWSLPYGSPNILDLKESAYLLSAFLWLSMAEAEKISDLSHFIFLGWHASLHVLYSHAALYFPQLAFHNRTHTYLKIFSELTRYLNL